jgi:hypothetical protein
MAYKPQKSPDAGLWEFGRRIGRQCAKAVRRTLRVIARNRFALLATIKVAQAAVKLIVAILEMFRHS